MRARHRRGWLTITTVSFVGLAVGACSSGSDPQCTAASAPPATVGSEAGVTEPGGEAGAPPSSDAGTPAEATITGHLVDFEGTPVPLFTVAIGGQLATTDVTGAFTLKAPLTMPYEARVIGRAGKGNVFLQRRVGVVFPGVARLDPTLMLPEGVVLPPDPRRVTTTVSGSLAGLGAGGGISGVVVWPLGSSFVTPGATYTANGAWVPTGSADTSRSVTAHLVFYTGAGSSTTYVAYGNSGPVTVNAGGTLPNVTITTAAPTLTTFSGTLSTPPSLAGVQATARFGFGTSFVGPATTNVSLNAGSTFSVAAPSIPGADYELALSSAIGGTRTVSVVVFKPAAGDNGTVAVPEPAGLVEPIDKSTVPLQGTVFRVQDASQGLRMVSFAYDDVLLFVGTTETSASLPDFAALGIEPPASGTQVTWSSETFGVANLADAYGAQGYGLARAGRPPKSTYFRTTTSSFNFFVK